MTGEIGPIGEAVTAGLAGVVAEPGHGQGKVGNDPVRCLNCGTALTGRFCHHCGQKSHVHRSFAAIGHDLLHAVLHFDGKFWNTLPLLLWRPGDLTRRYIHGERASFISPLALFLFAVFLTYAALASFPPKTGDFQPIAAADRQEVINGARTAMRDQLEQIDARIASARSTGASTAKLEGERKSIVDAARTMGLVDDSGPKPRISETAQRNFTITDLKTGIPFIDNGIKKANENPRLLLYKLQANAYKFAWALIPLSMPFLWLLYPFSRRFHMFDHFVFVTYSISFMLLLATFLWLAEAWLGDLGLLALLAMLWPPLHMYRQLRGAYRSSRFGSALRTLLLLVFAVITITFFMLLLLALGILG